MIAKILSLIARPHAATPGLIGLIVKLHLPGQNVLANNVLTFIICGQKCRDIHIAVVANKAHRQGIIIERYSAQLIEQCRGCAQVQDGENQTNADQPSAGMPRNSRETCLPVCHEISSHLGSLKIDRSYANGGQITALRAGRLFNNRQY